MHIVWSDDARSDLRKIARYIAQFNPAAARQWNVRIRTAVLPLADHPFIYREGRVPGTRELFPHPNYMVVYQVRADHVLRGPGLYG